MKWFVLFGILCLAGCGTSSNSGNSPSSSIKLMQSTSLSLTTYGDRSISETLTKNVVSGDLIVVAFYCVGGPTQSAVSVTDSLGNFYQQAVEIQNGAYHAWIYFATNVKGGPVQDVVTAIVSQQSTQFSIVALEYSGASALDASQTNSGPMTSDSTTSSSGIAVTHYAEELIVGVSLSDQLNTTMPGSGFTNQFASNYLMVEDKIVSTTGTYDAEFFLPTGCPLCIWEAAMATFH
jgi:hypothetical protein